MSECTPLVSGDVSGLSKKSGKVPDGGKKLVEGVGKGSDMVVVVVKGPVVHTNVAVDAAEIALGATDGTVIVAGKSVDGTDRSN